MRPSITKYSYISTTEAVAQRCSVKKEFLKIYKIRTKIPVPATFLKKETLAQVFFCEICEIIKNTFFYRAPSMTVSELMFSDINLAHIYPSF